MTDTARRMLRDRIMERNRGGEDYRDYRDYRDGRGDYDDGRRMRDRAMDYASGSQYRGDSRGDYRHEREPERYHEWDERDYDDGRRRGRNGRFVRDRYDGRGDRYDGHGEGKTKLKLPKEDMKRWGQMLMNADGTEGMHFDKRMLMERIKHMGGTDGYTEEDLCMAANMLYSDYCEVLKPYVSREPEKEADFYLKMAEAFLDDEDAPDGSAKLAMYYFCIADVED